MRGWGHALLGVRVVVGALSKKGASLYKTGLVGW